MNSPSRSTCPHCPDSSRLFVVPHGLNVHIGHKHKDVRTHPQSQHAGASQPGSSQAGCVRLEDVHLFKERVGVLKHIPKGARSSAAGRLSAIIDRCVKFNGCEDWCSLLTFAFFALRVPDRSDRQSLTAKVKDNVANLSFYLPMDNYTRQPRNLYKSIESRVFDGDLRGAVRMLVSDCTLAAKSVETQASLQEKHPAPSRALMFPDEPDLSCPNLHVTVEQVSAALSSFYSYSASGVDGIRPVHLKELTSSAAGDNGRRLLGSIAGLCNFLLKGMLNREVCPFLYGATLCALNKKGGGIRPIAVGTMFRRLVAKLGCRAVKDEISSYLHPHQLGFGTALGCEAAIHAARTFVFERGGQDAIVVKLDLKNAFNSVERDAILTETFRHGFPFSPTALAWDPIQKLLAIGDKGGNLRILGGPGVDAHVRHENGEAVLHAKFLVNEGALVTVTADDQLHLWTFRQKSPQRVQSLKFQRERITCLHLPLQSKWVHVGTERGNVHVVNIETFVLSGYVINWNKAIEVTRPNHPGAVVEISDNPLDASKLLIAFETGLIVVWDLRTRTAEWRGSLGGPGEAVRAAAWQHDNKILTAHVDGALATWSTRAPRPTALSYPHAKANKDGKLEPCKPILRLEWKTSRTGESLIIFSGGLPTDKAGRTHSITVLNGKSTTVLEMEHSVVDFVTLCESPHAHDYQDPYAIVVLLQNDLVVIDLLSPGYPCFENPYPMDIHESPVTCCSYLADCPSDLIPAFYSVGRQGNKKAAGFSEKLWPINGGEWAPASCSYSEIILTGHADGSVKFWDASAGTLQILYKLKCSKVFERRGGGGGAGQGGAREEEEAPLAIQQVALCAESRRLCVALPHGHVVLFKFRKTETHGETFVLEIPVISDALEEETSPEAEGGRSMSFSRGEGARDEGEARRSVVWSGAAASAVRVRGAGGTGGARRAPGFQPALVALQQGLAHPIVALTINSSYGLMAWGGERGVVVVDVSRRAVVAALAAHALYHAPDARAPATRSNERQRSPSLDQLEETARPSPAASPAELSAGAGNGTGTGQPDEPPAADRLETRRKSTSWKTFNLKRQLSKVDLKFKTAFTVPPENNLEEVGEKGNSQFFCETDEKMEAAPETLTESPDSDDTKTAEVEDEDKSADKSQLSSPLRVCSDVFERMHKELQEKRSSDVYDRMHKELQERWQDRDRIEAGVSPDLSPSKLEEEKANRPDNLPLFDDDGRPARPPRQKGKTKKEEGDKREQRDQRLLSVPNIKYSKQESVKDLRKRQAPAQPPASFAGNLMRRFRDLVSRLCPRNDRTDEDKANEQVVQVVEVPHRIDKLDSSFSRSRSSSMSSLENISQEGIQCLAFADSYTKKSDPMTLAPTLWIGTTLGSVLTMMINLPEADLRHTQPVVVSTSGGPIFRLKGSILTMSFLDCNGALIPYSYECWKDDSKDVRERRERTPTKQGSSGSGSRMSPTPASAGEGAGAGAGAGAGHPAPADRQFVVIASEKQARVVALPSQNCVYRQQIVDTDFVVKAEIVSLKDSVCLVNYLSTGHLVAYSLPSLRPLVDVDFLPLSELSFQTQSKQRGIVDPMLSIWGQQLIVNEDTDQIAKTFCFSNRGHGLFLASPTEIQKFTIDAEFCQQLNEMLGELFLLRDMPEPPKESFFRGLFGGGSRPLDREELFGESSGLKPNRTVAKHIPGPQANLEQLGSRASTAASEVSRAHMLVLERGEKLTQLEDRAERMSSQANEFSSSAHQLMLKYKDKKWYQL